MTTVVTAKAPNTPTVSHVYHGERATKSPYFSQPLKSCTSICVFSVMTEFSLLRRAPSSVYAAYDAISAVSMASTNDVP